MRNYNCTFVSMDLSLVFSSAIRYFLFKFIRIYVNGSNDYTFFSMHFAYTIHHIYQSIWFHFWKIFQIFIFTNCMERRKLFPQSIWIFHPLRTLNFTLESIERNSVTFTFTSLFLFKNCPLIYLNSMAKLCTQVHILSQLNGSTRRRV